MALEPRAADSSAFLAATRAYCWKSSRRRPFRPSEEKPLIWLGGEAGGEPGGVEAVNGHDAALAGEEPVIESAHVVAEHGDQAHPRDHHALPRVGRAARRARPA
jgi:hypothetical protein